MVLLRDGSHGCSRMRNRCNGYIECHVQTISYGLHSTLKPALTSSHLVGGAFADYGLALRKCRDATRDELHDTPHPQDTPPHPAEMSLTIPNAPNAGLFKQGYQKYGLSYPAAALYTKLTTPQQLRRRGWSRYSQHRRMPHHCPDRTDLPRPLWAQQDRHKPPPEDDPDLGCGDDNARA
jgi:hypothetical protein